MLTFADALAMNDEMGKKSFVIRVTPDGSRSSQSVKIQSQAGQTDHAWPGSYPCASHSMLSAAEAIRISRKCKNSSYSL
jgi:hypothetical protein